MNLAELHSFAMVARHGSFSRAARELGLTQPGVSRQVQRLERELGVELLHRRHGEVVLTDAGEHVLAYSEEVLERHRRLLDDLHGEIANLSGTLRIAASTTPGELLVPDIVAAFTARHPAVSPQIFITDSVEVITELRERHWHVGFTGARLPDPVLRYDVVAQDEIVLAVPAQHPFASRGEIALHELEGQPVLEREPGSGTLRSVRDELAKHGLSLPQYRVAMVLGTTQAIVLAVEKGHGVGWVSSLALARHPASGIAQVRIADTPLIRSLYLVTEPQRLLPPMVNAFVDWVRQWQAIRPISPL